MSTTVKSLSRPSPESITNSNGMFFNLLRLSTCSLSNIIMSTKCCLGLIVDLLTYLDFITTGSTLLSLAIDTISSVSSLIFVYFAFHMSCCMYSMASSVSQELSSDKKAFPYCWRNPRSPRIATCCSFHFSSRPGTSYHSTLNGLKPFLSWTAPWYSS